MPAAGYEIDLLRVRGLDRRNPLRAAGALRLAAAAVPAARRVAARARRPGRARRRRLRRRPGRPRRAALRPAAGADRGRPPPRAHQPDARPPRAPRLPRLPDRGARRATAIWSPAARCPAAILAADRGAARERFGIAAADRCLLVFGGSQGARSINLAALEAFAGAAGARARLPRPPHQRRARLPRAPVRRWPRRPTATATRCSSTSPGSPTRSPPPTSCSPAPAARSSRSPPRAAPSILVPYPHATADHQHANAAWMARRRGAAIVIEDAELDAGAPAGSGRRAARRPAAARSGWRRPRRALARPDAAERIAAEVLDAIGNT